MTVTSLTVNRPLGRLFTGFDCFGKPTVIACGAEEVAVEVLLDAGDYIPLVGERCEIPGHGPMLVSQLELGPWPRARFKGRSVEASLPAPQPAPRLRAPVFGKDPRRIIA